MRTGFAINGFINHYPDFIVRTRSGKIVIIETKGDHLANEETLAKLHLGRAWQAQAGPGYRYFLVFQDKDISMTRAYRGIAVAHLQLQLREIPEHGGMVRGERVAAHIRHPVTEPGGTAQGLPPPFPVAGNVAVALADAPHATQGNRTPAARLACAGAYDDMTLGPVDIPIFEAAPIYHE